MEQKHFVCTNCGYAPTNTALYCDMGCGRDYHRMINVSETINKLLALAAYSASQKTRKDCGCAKCLRALE